MYCEYQNKINSPPIEDKWTNGRISTTEPINKNAINIMQAFRFVCSK